MKIFITGGDGLLGSNLVRELLDRGHEICVLVQSGREVNTLDGLNIKKADGNLLDYESLIKAAKDSDAIFHLAASTSIWPSRNKFVNEINIDGTKNIIRLAKELNVKRLIHCGTANTFSFGSSENPGIENTEYRGLKYGLDYMDSKWKAHNIVVEAIKNGLPAVIVNPTFMLGAYDSTPSSGKMIIEIFKQKVPFYAPGGRNYICVKDAAIGIANALDMGRIGESYLIGNENLSYKEIFNKIGSELEVKPPKNQIPKAFLLAYAWLSSSIAYIINRRPTVTYPMAKIACDTHYFSVDKAIKELKLPQTPIEVGIKEGFEWLNSNGYIN